MQSPSVNHHTPSMIGLWIEVFVREKQIVKIPLFVGSLILLKDSWISKSVIIKRRR
jgi:hypothetical protein